MDICLNQLIQFYSNNATNLHHLTSQVYAVKSHNIDTCPEITVTSFHSVYNRLVGLYTCGRFTNVETLQEKCPAKDGNLSWSLCM